jgi:hypothetical protein
MGGANTGRSNEEEVNPPGELRLTTPTINTENASSPTRHKVSKHLALTSFWGRHPDISQLLHAQQTTNTTFRDRRPGIPPLALQLRRHTTQPPAAQAAQGKLLVDHGRHTNIRGRRPGLKVKPPPLRRVDQAGNLAALAT